MLDIASGPAIVAIEMMLEISANRIPDRRPFTTARNGQGVVKQGSDVCDACRSWVSIKKANQSNTVTNRREIMVDWVKLERLRRKIDVQNIATAKNDLASAYGLPDRYGIEETTMPKITSPWWHRFYTARRESACCYLTWWFWSRRMFACVGEEWSCRVVRC